MKPETQNLLAPFYFGSISDADRLKIEQELLLDTESLVDYLDLKRQIEFAKEIPQMPSPRLWRKLEAQLKPRKKLFFTLSFAAGLAASIFIAALFFKTKSVNDNSTNGAQILFDSSGELSASSNVL